MRVGSLNGLSGNGLVHRRSVCHSRGHVFTHHGGMHSLVSSGVMRRAGAGEGSLEEEDRLGSSSKLMWALVRNPVAFLGGCFVGIMELDVAQDPLKGWIEERVDDMRGGR